MQTKIKITTVSVIKTSFLSGRKEYEDDHAFFIVESETQNVLKDVIREFPGAKLIRNYLKQFCRTELGSKWCMSNLAYAYDEDDFHFVADIEKILERAQANYEQGRRETVFTIYH
jgi:hypothetical protein